MNETESSCVLVCVRVQNNTLAGPRLGEMVVVWPDGQDHVQSADAKCDATYVITRNMLRKIETWVVYEYTRFSCTKLQPPRRKHSNSGSIRVGSEGNNGGGRTKHGVGC